MKQNTKLITIIIISGFIGAIVGSFVTHQISFKNSSLASENIITTATSTKITEDTLNSESNQSGSHFLANLWDDIKKLIPKWVELKPSEQPETSASPTPIPTPAFYNSQVAYEQKIIEVVQKSSPAVVSIIITKNVPIVERYYTNPFEELPPEFQQFFWPFFQFEIPQYQERGTEKREVGGGTGFIISSDGLILTNKHVVSDENAEYTVFLTNGDKYQAKILAQDPIDDIALIKIEANNLPTLPLGNSDGVQLGQTVIAIGNALSEFRNTVSVGVVSGLARSVVASDQMGNVETIEDVIQTDAAINFGNSGGPLINLNGEVIGINTAIASGAENIGFAIPINRASKDIRSYQTSGKISAPFIGIRYTIITPSLQKEKNLPVDYGALVSKGQNGEPAVFPDSPAASAGIKEGDIILEINGQKITVDRSLSAIIKNYNAGEKIILKVLRDQQELNIEVVLADRPDNL